AVELWEPDGGKVVRTLGAVPDVRAMAFSRDGKRLAAGSGDGWVSCWAVPAAPAGEWKPVLSVKAHALDVIRLAFSPRGRTRAAPSVAQPARLGAVTGPPAAAAPPAAPRELLTIRGHTEDVFDLTWLPDGKRLLTGGDQTAKVWDVAWTCEAKAGPRA